MKVEFKQWGKWIVVAVGGRIDALTSPQLDAAFKTGAGADALWWAVDLSDAEYISSAGLRVLLAALKAAKAKHGGLALVHPRGNVQEVLEVAGFTRIMPTVARVEDLP